MTVHPHAPGEKNAPYRTLLDRLAADLIGPASREGPWTDIPSEAFMTGILFPKDSDVAPEDETVADVDLATSGGEHGENSADLTPRVETAMRPAAAGLSFALATENDLPAEVTVSIAGARYVDEQGEPVVTKDGKTRPGRRLWSRCAITGTLPMLEISGGKSLYLASELDDLAFEGLILTIVSSAYPEGAAAGETARLVTLVVHNEGTSKEAKNDRFAMNRQCLFEFQMTVRAGEGSRLIGRPLRGRGKEGDEDERAAALLWRNAEEYAVGHTCAAHWDIRTDPVEEVSTAWLPATRVPETSADGHAYFANVKPRLAAKSLADPGHESETVAVLHDLVTAYERWMAETRTRIAADVPFALQEQAERHIDICTLAARRMRDGIAILERDSALMQAFRWANQAMYLQQAWKPAKDGEEPRSLVWRPFQIGFFLLSSASSVLPDHDNRAVMDLIWFPTGGGKTEAYLLLTAFTIFARRLHRGERGQGVCAIMRYTLRLLTLQQFERAAAMICAANLIWRDEGYDVEKEPISLGLWLGAATTPNKREHAISWLEGRPVKDVGSPNRLEFCPCCHERLDWHTTGDQVEITCGKEGCSVGDAGALPLYTNDDDIYDSRPSLVIGTADKFAQIARNSRTENLFGARHDLHNPPDLIIQDELHLISGPLGTLTGLYETAIDSFCTMDGCGPKVIGSTATIRRASEQVKALFARETMQFPPPGIDANDSAFAVEDSERLGRLYVGVSTIGHSKPEILQAICASLLQSALFLDGKERDAAWTLLGYFNSLKELGGSVTLLQAIAPETMKRLARANGDPDVRDVSHQIEITSRISSEDIGGVLGKLFVEHDKPGSVDVALATNMISVGVDVERLGLMVVDGQPKGISEYIQATSRVGRSSTDGLVIGLYTAYRPRDRSRFETHRTWHGALYRDVEATSVTPFAPRARDRALHAPFVAIAAHENPKLWSVPGGAQEIRPQLEAIIERMVARVADVDAEEADATRAQLNAFLNEWCLQDDLSAWWDDRNNRSLLMSLEHAAQLRAAKRRNRSAKPTPNSMRGVESTVRIDLETP